MRKYGTYFIFIAAMLWATDAPFRAHLTQGLSSNFIVLVEHFFDVLVVLPILLLNLKDLKHLTKKEWGAVLFIAIGGSALASIAFTQAFHYVNPSVAILLQKLQPLIAIGLAASLLGERRNKNFWIWATIALIGAYFISFGGLKPELFPGEKLNPNVMGVLLALVAAFFWGGSTVMGRYMLSSVNFKVMTALRFSAAFVFLLILNFWQKSIPPLASVTGKDWLFLFIIAITSGVVSLFVYYKGLQTTKASVATIAELGFPLAAVLVNYASFKMGWIAQNTALNMVQLLGMAILLFSVYNLSRVNEQITQKSKLI
jgi:drug/metabolite transporter (DMT)-like permease